MRVTATEPCITHSLNTLLAAITSLIKSACLQARSHLSFRMPTATMLENTHV